MSISNKQLQSWKRGAEIILREFNEGGATLTGPADKIVRLVNEIERLNIVLAAANRYREVQEGLPDGTLKP